MDTLQKATRLLCLCIFFCTGQLLWAQNDDISSLLLQLDYTLKERPANIAQYELKLKEMNQVYEQLQTDDTRFDFLGKLLDEYRSFNVDSSLAVAQRRYHIALRLNNKEHINNARMNMAEVLGTAGMYKEAIDLMQPIHIDSLPEYLHSYYYHIYRTIYGLMADYAVTKEEKEHYTALTNNYRDSLAQSHTQGSPEYVLVISDCYNIRDEYDKAIQSLSQYLEKYQNDTRYTALLAYTLSESYRLMGDLENSKKYLIISAIADMQLPVREYVSLRKLSILLFHEGQVERAYAYLKLCMDDAVACNARLRILEILEIFPIVNDAYQQKLNKQQVKMKWALVFISLLSFFLLVAMFYVYKQMKRIAAARKEVIEANKQLKELNKKLCNSNDKLKEANHNLAESSYLKEEYIGRYMDLCSIYLDKMDNYRRQLGKIASKGNVEELYTQIKSSKFIEQELKEFYANFDSTFLHLFPSFIEDINSLLLPEEQMQSGPHEQLNTELRILALIRLGITDSVKIAHFLRYSVTTIYNYRTKMRNKASGDRNLLERQVMKIGSLRMYETS